MVVFLKRNRGYQFGILLLVLALGLYIMGLSSPFWTEYHFDPTYDDLVYAEYAHSVVQTAHSYAGLWKVCTREAYETHCESTPSESGWYISVKVLQCLGLAGYLLASGYAVVINCRKRDPAYNRWLEMASGASSIAALTGVLMYVASAQDELMSKAQQDRRNQSGVLKYHLSWAFYLDLAACLASVVASVQIGLYNRPLQSPDTIPVLAPGSDDSDYAHAHDNPAEIVTDSMARPPPYYVLFPQSVGVDVGGGGGGGSGSGVDGGAPKPADVVEGATGLGPQLSHAESVSAGDTDTEEPPSYEAAISPLYDSTVTIVER